MTSYLRISALFIAGSCVVQSNAELITTFESNEWQAMVGDFSTIDFTGFPDGTLISDQYAEVGVMVTGLAFIAASNVFPNDGWGLHGPNGLHLFFDTPQSWIAIDHAANAFFELYYQGSLVGISDFNPVGGIGSFLGVLSAQPFDEVIITKPPFYGTHIGVDDLHWGAIPAPGALGLLIMAGLAGARRRR